MTDYSPSTTLYLEHGLLLVWLKQHKQLFAVEFQLGINHTGVLPLSVLVWINRLEFESFKTLSECPHSACLGTWEML